MLDRHGKVIYVGKARDLRRRVGSYFQGRAQDAKTIALLKSVANIEVTVTRNEVEALMLEYNMIKRHRPRFNVVLRDDKSYPYIYLNQEHEFPRLSFYRGPRAKKGRLFGPYPSAGSVRETLSQLQKLFQLRGCEDSYFENRSRPCLQHQIGRCTAPCVGLITPRRLRSRLGACGAVPRGRQRRGDRQACRAHGAGGRKPSSSSVRRNIAISSQSSRTSSRSNSWRARAAISTSSVSPTSTASIASQ